MWEMMRTTWGTGRALDGKGGGGMSAQRMHEAEVKSEPRLVQENR